MYLLLVINICDWHCKFLVEFWIICRVVLNGIKYLIVLKFKSYTWILKDAELCRMLQWSHTVRKHSLLGWKQKGEWTQSLSKSFGGAMRRMK
jgi:hypothetical protein